MGSHPPAHTHQVQHQGVFWCAACPPWEDRLAVPNLIGEGREVLDEEEGAHHVAYITVVQSWALSSSRVVDGTERTGLGRSYVQCGTQQGGTNSKVYNT